MTLNNSRQEITMVAYDRMIHPSYKIRYCIFCRHAQMNHKTAKRHLQTCKLYHTYIIDLMALQTITHLSNNRQLPSVITQALTLKCTFCKIKKTAKNTLFCEDCTKEIRKIATMQR